MFVKEKKYIKLINYMMHIIKAIAIDKSKLWLLCNYSYVTNSI